jgi:hypothetical protein
MLAALGAAAACTSGGSSSTAATASVAAPIPFSPGNALQLRYIDQPIALVVQNAVSTQSGSTYTFEVAADAAFASKVQTKDGVSEGSGGRTTVMLDSLAASKDYYWHARATSGGTTGLFGPVYKFTIGPAVSLSTPSPIAPLTNATTGTRPTLRVSNVTRTGTPAGPITYKFEISTSSSFATAVFTATVAEGINETGVTPTVDLALNTLYYWRATALDIADGFASTPSSVQSFTPVSALWPGQVPPGTNGHAVRGGGWDPQTVTAFDGTVFSSPPLDESRIFDLIDRGFDPQGAIDWLNTHGYSTAAVWYPGTQTIGFQYTYMAFINGAWQLVLRVGA